jgi:hypothetical protein
LFTPTVLTILGVIMYLSLGWVVGNAGLLGALLIIFIAVGITLATGLSLSSIATNTRLGAGGPYAIITKSLGLEVGGSVGVPLVLSQALAVAMYVFGFREGWIRIFPDHPALLVDLAAFAVVFAVALVSANFAFQIFALHERAGLGRESVVNLWIRPPERSLSAADALQAGNMNLAILTAYRLARAWRGELNVISVVREESRTAELRGFLEEIRDLCRLPDDTGIHVLFGEFQDRVGEAPQSDVDVIGMPERASLNFARRMVELTRSSCVLVSDSGLESALA